MSQGVGLSGMMTALGYPSPPCSLGTRAPLIGPALPTEDGTGPQGSGKGLRLVTTGGPLVGCDLQDSELDCTLMAMRQPWIAPPATP